MNFHAQPLRSSANCPKHGDFERLCYFGDSWTACPRCADEEAARVANERSAIIRAGEREAWQRRLGDTGIPERFMDRRLRNYVATTPGQRYALDFALDFAEHFGESDRRGQCAIFLGQPGTGKTHLAIGIGHEIMARGSRTVLFTTVMRAVRRVKDTWVRGSAESESAAVAALAYPDLLILDEIGVQFGSETEKLILFDVLNERYEKRRQTILLSNLAVDDDVVDGRRVPGIRSFLGERVFDRLREDGGEAVVFDWESHRGKVAA
ncbi:ATP-binding protein [Pandoraea bronchicola]|uniref:DNA replication protein DnaC n=1 Tax=Pandoraea bronchicola TaxID=2508287 RepID=A0A5E5BR87_9BURK|nr:ATP-binding protein [Pandoraea bronchicola]VVE87575.1 DNA replication protein DnaC [Pandoraea bronchicola]